jgi:SHS2 domain-containing protein
MSRPSVAYEILEHPADVGFRAFGPTLEALFENAALALASLMVDPETVVERDSRALTATGTDLESLLYDWLSVILAIADAERWVFRRFRVEHLEPGRVTGIGYGEPLDKTRHHLGTYIKAVTLHQFRVEQTPTGWSAQVYLDV